MTLLFYTCLLGSAAAAPQPREQQALWLSHQLHRTIEASQILISPSSTTLEGCTITRTRLAPTGATALSLRCPQSPLPHLLLLDTGGPHPPAVGEGGVQSAGAPHRPQLADAGSHQPGVQQAGTSTASPNIVHAGAALKADWRTAFIHAQLPVIALEAGAAGAEIRVRVPQTQRIVRARILSADTVAIVVAGA